MVIFFLIFVVVLLAELKPLEGGPARNIPVTEKKSEDRATVLYVGRIPHGFYDDEMEGTVSLTYVLFFTCLHIFKEFFALCIAFRWR